MTFRSRLFATVALPVLSAALVATPTLADALMTPLDMAQESSDQGQPSEEELLLQQQKQDETPHAAEEQKPAEDQQVEQPAEQQDGGAAETMTGEQPATSDGEQPATSDSEQPVVTGEDGPAETTTDQPATAETGETPVVEPVPEEQKDRAAEEQQPAEDQQAEQPTKQQDDGTSETTAGERPAGGEDEQPAAGEEKPAVAGEESPAETGTDQPATAETGQSGEMPATEPVPEVVDTLTTEQKQEIAEDPTTTDETVVLPVENGAAVLDSDKDADNTGGRKSREERRKQREELRAQEEDVPDSDDSAQTAISEEVREAVPGKIEAAIKEEGERVEEAPDFAVPETTNIINNTVINNTVINNNTVNNTTIDNSDTEVKVVERLENRTVLEVGDRLIVRGDDRPRLRRDSEEVNYDNLARGRVRETIARPGGVKIVTIYNRYGDIIQRSRVGRDGREYILVYAPELEDDSPRPGLVDVGYELPPMRLRIPVTDYIIDTSGNPDRDYYAFLSEPPVERVERVYTIDEVKHSARLRDKVRRIDLDTVTFATGSAEVPMSQARTLRTVAEAMQKVLDKDPGETFLIEGHTDAVGSDKSNLVLSDERAESVASLLTEVYGIPPENLQTQGYGERFLKVRTEVAEQQNRRVTIRRVTTLVRPMARAN